MFTKAAIARIHRLSRGIPRIINVLCDRSLLGAFSESSEKVNRTIVNRAGREVLTDYPGLIRPWLTRWFRYAGIALVPVVGYLAFSQYHGNSEPAVVEEITPTQESQVSGPQEDSGEADQGGNPFDVTWRLGVPLKSRGDQ